VITDLGVLGFDESGEMELQSLNPGIELPEVLAQTGWPLKVASVLERTEPPAQEELDVLRELLRQQQS